VQLSQVVDPLPTWLYAERYLGVGTRGYSPYSADAEVSEPHHPQHGGPGFAVPTFWIPLERGTYLRNGHSSALHEQYCADGEFLLPVHPDTLSFAGLPGRDDLLASRPGPPLWVVPTANARTVLVERIGDAEPEPHFVKLHFPRRLSRFTRRLRQPIIELQLWVADELDRVGVPVLPEVGGGVFGIDADQAWGFLLRETAPRHGAGPPFTVPLFALYGNDLLHPDDPSLLEQLIAVSGEDPLAYAVRRIIEPMVGLWLTAALGAGCTLELHGQNTLFAFNADGSHTRVLYRDCGIYVDPAIRADHGLAGLPRVNVISADIAAPREQVWSLTYDSFMGHHVLQRLAALLRDHFGVSVAALQSAAREAFATRGGSPSLLPPTVYYYDNTLLDAGNWRLVDTGEAPLWR